MLTVYSTYGSPGASTTAIYLAAHWASSGRQVLLIETDSAAGSLSQKLGIQFTPGTASFMAAGKPVTSANLIEHAQDVLFSDFHVMPTPSSPSGAKTVGDKFDRLGEELRDISDSEMAIIVDGGRLTADASTSELTTSAAAVLIVTRDDTQLSSLEHVSSVLVADASQPGPLGLVATVGPSPLSEAEWSGNHGLRLVGSADLGTERGTDLTMFMHRGKRKSRKLRGSLEKLADALYEYACPASADAPRTRLPAHRPEPDAAPADAPAHGADAPLTADPNDLLAGVPPVAPAPAPPLPPAATMPPMQYDQQPPAPAAYQPPPQPEYPQPQYPQPEYPQPQYPQQGYPSSDHAVPSHGDAPQPTYAGQPQPYPAPPSGYDYSDYGGQGAPPYEQPTHAEQPHATPEAYPPPVPPVEAPTVPTGSFRSWAVQLFGESAGGEPDDKRPRPGAGASA